MTHPILLEYCRLSERDVVKTILHLRRALLDPRDWMDIHWDSFSRASRLDYKDMHGVYMRGWEPYPLIRNLVSALAFSETIKPFEDYL